MTVALAEKEAYSIVEQKAYAFIRHCEKCRRTRYTAVCTALQIFLSGLPQTVVLNFEPIRKKDMMVVVVKKSRGKQEFILLPHEIDAIKNAVAEIRGVYATPASTVRALQRESKNFKKWAKLESLTHMDMYALKLCRYGLMRMLPERYPSRRLSLITTYIANAVPATISTR